MVSAISILLHNDKRYCTKYNAIFAFLYAYDVYLRTNMQTQYKHGLIGVLLATFFDNMILNCCVNDILKSQSELSSTLYKMILQHCLNDIPRN